MGNRETQRAFKARQRAAGLAQVTEWIPVRHKALHREVAKALREGRTVTIAPKSGAPDTNPVEDMPWL